MSHINDGPFGGQATSFANMKITSGGGALDTSKINSFRELNSLGSTGRDPESSMALGQESGLINALQENGFDFYIDFKELRIDTKSDFIGRGGYGDVFKARWLGTKVAVKKFGKRYMTKKALKDFIKEIEMLN